MVRSAGGSAQLLAKEGEYAQIRMPSGEVRLDPSGMLCHHWSDREYLNIRNIKLGKAGRKRHMGIRPTVRGTAMCSP